jgi:hypothetical protein
VFEAFKMEFIFRFNLVEPIIFRDEDGDVYDEIFFIEENYVTSNHIYHTFLKRMTELSKDYKMSNAEYIRVSRVGGEEQLYVLETIVLNGKPYTEGV